MIPLGNLINSEGPILSMHCDKDGEIIIQIYSSEFQGTLSISPKFSDCISYLESKINLEELITLSKSSFFDFNNADELQRIPLSKIVSSLPFVDRYYKDVPDSLK